MNIYELITKAFIDKYNGKLTIQKLGDKYIDDMSISEMLIRIQLMFEQQKHKSSLNDVDPNNKYAIKLWMKLNG